MSPFSNSRPWSLCITRGMQNRNNIDLFYQHVRNRVCTFILDREGLRPLTRVVCNHQDASISVRSWVTHIQDIHNDTVPSMIGRNVPQGVVASGQRFSFDSNSTLSKPFFDIIRHAWPIKVMRQSGQCPISAQMNAKHRCMIWQEQLFASRLRNQQL